jgi:hypothetical protein
MDRFGDGLLRTLPFRSPEGMILVMLDEEGEGELQGEQVKTLMAFKPRGGRLLWFTGLENWLLNESECMLAGGILVMPAQRLDAHQGRRSLITLDLADGRVTGQASFDPFVRIVEGSGRLPGDHLMLHSAGTRSVLELSSFDFRAMDYRFRDKRFRVGEDTTLDTRIGTAAYAADGAAIPFDFSTRRPGESSLASQVLLVDGRDGRLLHGCTIHLDFSDWRRRRRYASSRHPTQVLLREGTVLVLKQFELRVIQTDPNGG